LATVLLKIRGANESELLPISPAKAAQICVGDQDPTGDDRKPKELLPSKLTEEFFGFLFLDIEE